MSVPDSKDETGESLVFDFERRNDFIRRLLSVRLSRMYYCTSIRNRLGFIYHHHYICFSYHNDLGIIEDLERATSDGKDIDDAVVEADLKYFVVEFGHDLFEETMIVQLIDVDGVRVNEVISNQELKVEDNYEFVCGRIINVLGVTNYSLSVRNCEHVANYIFNNAWFSKQIGRAHV